MLVHIIDQLLFMSLMKKRIIEQEIKRLLENQIYPVIVTEIKKFESFTLQKIITKITK